jgi:hypothetical protein
VASRRLPVLAWLVAFVALAWGCQRDPVAVLTRLDDARKLAADIRVQFSKGADASNRAVMADTDEASVAFAREAEQATNAVERDVAALVALLSSLGFPSEIQITREFSAHFAEYQKLDRKILALAVENTNLKAQALSFGPASQSAATFRDSLSGLASSFPAKDRCRVERLVAQALLSVREIQVLHAPHIAEHDDAPMTGMEKEMAHLDATARVALKSLGEGAPTEARPALADALGALDNFKAISGQIVALSRRNTNVLSLDLALRKRPPLGAVCDDRLRALQGALAKEGSKATR